jgi:hypothetical protein
MNTQKKTGDAVMNFAEPKIEPSLQLMKRNTTLVHDNLCYSRALATIFAGMASNCVSSPEQRHHEVSR